VNSEKLIQNRNSERSAFGMNERVCFERRWIRSPLMPLVLLSCSSEINKDRLLEARRRSCGKPLDDTSNPAADFESTKLQKKHYGPVTDLADASNY
jgi:hypothetical protein